MYGIGHSLVGRKRSEILFIPHKPLHYVTFEHWDGTGLGWD